MKKENKLKLLNRLDCALRSMYHNATPHHPRINSESLWQKYEAWFNHTAECEVEYMRDGLGCSPKEYAKYLKRGFWPEGERYCWLVSRINDYGKLYTWGRGGRTLAPDGLISRRGGGSFRCKGADNFSDYSNGAITELVAIIEAFNSYVGKWCSADNLASMWQEEARFQAEQLKVEAGEVLSETRELLAAIRSLRNTPEKVCAVLIEKVKTLREAHAALMREVFSYSRSVNTIGNFYNVRG